MSGITEFEDLVAWQKARILTKAVYGMTRKESFVRDYGLSNQIQRASVSIMANVAEGFARKNPNEFYHFTNIAKSSCSEVQSHLYVALDCGYIVESEFRELREQTREVARLLGGLLVSIDRRRQR